MTQHFPGPFMGILASAGSVITAFQNQLDWAVKFSGSCVLLIIALLSLFRTIRDFNNPTK